jgi:hypothetical protein
MNDFSIFQIFFKGIFNGMETIEVKKKYIGTTIHYSGNVITLYNSLPQKQLAFLMQVLGSKYFIVKKPKDDTTEA